MREEQEVLYHEDETEKLPLRNADIRFLQELQKEMNTQDTLGQADPRFWVIKGKNRIYLNDPDGYELCYYCEKVAENLEDAARYLQSEGFSDHTGLRAEASFEDAIISPEGRLSVAFSEMPGPGYEDCVFYDTKSLADWLNEYQGNDAFTAVPYMDRQMVYSDTLFLTRKEAMEHLRRFHYHYDDEAHTYAMTAWRAPDVERLYGILEETDFQELERAAGYKDLLDRMVDNLLVATKPEEVLRYLLYLGFSRKDLLDLNFDEADIAEEEQYMSDLTDFSGICPIF